MAKGSGANASRTNAGGKAPNAATSDRCCPASRRRWIHVVPSTRDDCAWWPPARSDRGGEAGGGIFSAGSLEQLKVIAGVLLGGQSFSAGVCYGIVKNPVVAVAGVLDLAKTLVLADLYDRIFGGPSWRSLGGSPVVTAAQVALRVAVAKGLLSGEKLRQAFDARQALVEEMGNILANPLEFLAELPGKMADEYKEKWREFNDNYAKKDPGSQFKAGEIFGDLLMEIGLAIAGLGTGVGAAARLASKAPRLLRLAEAFKGGSKTVRTIAAEAAPAKAPTAAAKAPASKAPPPPPPTAKGPPAPEPPPPAVKQVAPEDPNRVHRDKSTLTGHPVDVATGKVLTEKVDFETEGPLPLRWERVWYSTSRHRGPIGHGWHHCYDSALLEVAADAMVLRTPDGRDRRLPALGLGEESYDRQERSTFFRDEDGYGLRTGDGLIHRFGAVIPGEPQRLVRIEDASGNALQFAYDEIGLLQTMTDSGGRELHLTYDLHRRISQITGPHPTEPNLRQVVIAYAYDAFGNLVDVRDALGQSMRFEYQHHLLVKETNRNGLSFHFQYEAEVPGARCLRTWGDGGIYDHKLDYQIGCTTVTNSLGYKTKHFHARGLVFRTVDALGAVTETARNEWDEVVREVDPLGETTVLEHDQRGNVVAITPPDGATIKLAYDARDRPTQATDALGGTWRWQYDDKGRLVEHEDPLGRTTAFRYAGKQLVELVDPAGLRTELEYDQSGALIAVRMPNGAESRWAHDRLGRVIRAIDPKGNEQRRQHDALGRVVQVDEPDGNVRTLSYDAEGNVIHAKDRQHDVRFRYVGMGRVAARTEADTTVAFEYDQEEQLVAVRNEHGDAYRFVLGPTGQVNQEISFDGITRTYHRDTAGRVRTLNRPSGVQSSYQYDAVGRVLGVRHSDGTEEGYRYRRDGALVKAVNDSGSLAFERDAVGRIIKESGGGEWVASTFDLLGRRTSIRSSKNFEQHIDRNPMGDVLGVRAGVSQLRATSPEPEPSIAETGGQTGGRLEAMFEAHFTRDELGLELERSLPGGVRARWERDKLGRPLRHELRSGANLLFAKQYVWESNDRLRMVVDALKGPVKYTHDALGNLAAAVYEDGRIDLRMPDAVGNLFRTEARDDRKYGPAGQLLESRGPDGTTRYEYDADGNLAQKTEPDGGTWLYNWNAAGMLAKVTRPDGETVEFGYDPLGRRIWKKYRGKTTRWIWDGNVPLHEWVELDAAAFGNDEVAPPTAAADHAAAARLAAQLTTSRPAQGPPPAEGTKAHPITWVFEPESFAPLAKLVGTDRYSIITDHLGTPMSMLDAEGRQTWAADTDAYGDLRNVVGDRQACPFRWPGQYEDAETGLYYNRFRYYQPSVGHYIQADPIGLRGGLQLYGYVRDPLTWVDPLGLCGQSGQPNENVASSMGPSSFDKPNATRSGANWSRAPKSIQDQMTLDAARQGAGSKIIDNLGDPKFKGMEKWEYRVKSTNGNDSVVHYVRDPKEGDLTDFKFTKHSTEGVKAWGNDPVVSPIGR